VTEKNPRKLKPPRRALAVSGIGHVRYSLEALNHIAREIKRETGRNFEERAQWRATWDTFVKRTREGK
jgi:hypothetical protein